MTEQLPYIVVPLTRGTDPEALKGFTCGVDAYDEWLSLHAIPAVAGGSAAVYLLIEVASGRVVGYFTISPTNVVREDLTGKIQRGLMRAVPAYLIGKLAVAVDRQGLRPPLGPQLVLAAIAKVIAAAEVGGGQLIVIDADSERLVPFYERCGFVRASAQSTRLVMKVSTARRALGAAQMSPQDGQAQDR